MSKSAGSHSSSKRTLSSSPYSARYTEGRRNPNGYSVGRSPRHGVGSPPSYPPRKGGISLPSSFQSEEDFLEEDELGEDLAYFLDEQKSNDL